MQKKTHIQRLEDSGDLADYLLAQFFRLQRREWLHIKERTRAGYILAVRKDIKNNP